MPDRRQRWRALILMGAALPLLAAMPRAPEVRLDAGTVRGVAAGAGGVFKGIPYAAAPTGALRWAPTQPIAAWSGVRDASRFGPVCPQPARAGRLERIGQSEDCLTINVASPRLGAAAKLPVLVEVHGGAFAFGSAAEHFDSSAQVMNRNGIVYVAMNYRIGRLGFFAHPGLRAGQPGAAVANYWLMDQIAALHWVKRNIAAFGGDPAKVTILGCSAGGSSINALMVSPESRGLFARASARSGGGLFNATRPLDRAEREGLAFAERAEVTGEGADAIVRLRALTPEQVMAADPGPPNFGAVIDGRLLKDEIAVSFAKGEIARVPFMVGSTSNEASVFGLMGFDAALLKARFGIDLADLRPIYDPAGTMSETELLRQVQTDFIFTSGATALAGFAAKHQPVWAYHFGYVPSARRGQDPGAPHCADMGYIFGHAPDADTPEGQKMAALLQGYVADFVRKGDPNGKRLPVWPGYRGAQTPVLLIEERARAVPGFRARQLAYWHQRWSAGSGYPIEPAVRK
jgi:para-nitrobenzyl esterase